jgi:hypothetical protein
MYRILFKIKQHTPMIHFQHDQDCATLRASELKPKLDQYLIENIFKKDFNFYKKNLINWSDDKNEKNYNEKLSFNYKVKINCYKSEPFEIETKTRKKDGKTRIKQFPMYFGNMGNEKEAKKFVFSNKPLIIQFFSFNKNILDKIELCFIDFLFVTNFGTRQTKGFGSFYLHGSDPRYKKPHSEFNFSVRLNKSANHNTLIDKFRYIYSDIDLFYKTLRSGINEVRGRGQETVFYFKSLMFKYSLKYGIQWDKKSIKEHFFLSDLEEQNAKHKYPDVLNKSFENQALMKDLLGLSSSENWRIPYRSTITKEHDKISRFRSPITFKIIRDENNVDRYNVFIIYNQVEDGFLKEVFTIKCESKIKKMIKGHLELITPSKFDIKHFLLYAFTENIKDHVEERFHDTLQFRKIYKIYKEIRNNFEVRNA